MYSGDHWLNHKNFASFEEWKNRQEQCIAPVDKDGEIRLCRMKITHESQDAAMSYKLRAESLPAGSQRRDIAVRDFIVTLCCDKWHRSKIESPNLTETLSDLVLDYRRAMKSASTRYSSGTEPQVEQAPQLPPTARFQKYRPGDEENVTVREELCEDVDSTFVRWGTIYCATWPALPGFVKIGYTTGTAFDRVAQLQECLKDARVEASFVFPYPEKFEGLIHRELRRKRRIEGFCGTCYRTHTEFFEIRAMDAIHVMFEWYRLCQEKELYNKRRALRSFWSSQLDHITGDVTAYDLLRALHDLPPENDSASVDEVTLQLGRLSTTAAR